MANEKRLIDANAIPYEEHYVPDGDVQWGYKKELCVCKPAIDQMPTVDAVEVVRCSYCDPGSQDYNPCWLCKKGGTAHDVEHCHKTNYGDYEPMQPHCHLCGRKL